jgi:hypothetical protein
MSSSHGFNTLVIKSKNTLKDKNKIIFHEFFILKKLLNHAMYFFYMQI